MMSAWLRQGCELRPAWPGFRLFHSTATLPKHSAMVQRRDTPIALDSVLIANRGEISRRIARTCRQWNIPVTSVSSAQDTPLIPYADYHYTIGSGPRPADSYLRGEEYIALCQRHNIQAIHPGYGFLSENVAFAQAIQATPNLVWIGPPVTAMEQMASKSVAKRIMQEAGVPTVPSYMNDEQQDSEHLLQQARDIGFPVLIKAVMGGGGKGMRIVWNEAEFGSHLQACQREAAAAFGNDIVLLEKYLDRPKHIEVQILADTHGNVISLYERDCSLQRRHQKIIEEAPASTLSDELRHDLSETAKQAARAVNYVNAGTVEFLMDLEGNYYFCEMNTRLQVEHPVTELVTGVDLVEWQLRVAAGEVLPSQDEVPCHGHAFEARVYAENPAKGFLPATGTLWHYQEPPQARVDSAMDQVGQEISVYYDPMISKLIVHDDNRDLALKKLIQALKEYKIAGVPTNLDFLVQCAEHEVFQDAQKVNTGFLEDVTIALDSMAISTPLDQAVGAVAAQLFMEQRDSPNKSTQPAVWSTNSGSWRLGGALGYPQRNLAVVSEDDTVNQNIVCVCLPDGSYQVSIQDTNHTDAVGQDAHKSYHIKATFVSEKEMQVTVDGTQRIVATTALQLTPDGVIQVRMWPRSPPQGDYAWQLDVLHPLLAQSSLIGAAAVNSGNILIKSPMPGTIRSIECVVGQPVKQGQTLVVLEAMKMEHALKSPRDGIVVEVRHQESQVVPDGTVLVVIGEEEIEPKAQQAAG